MDQSSQQPREHNSNKVEGEDGHLGLSSDLHVCTHTCSHECAHAQIYAHITPPTHTQLVVPFSSDYRKECIIPVCQCRTNAAKPLQEPRLRDTRQWQKPKSPKPAAAGIQTGVQPVNKTRKHNGKAARVLGLSQ